MSDPHESLNDASLEVIQKQIFEADGEAGWRLLNQYYFRGDLTDRRAVARRGGISDATRKAYISDLGQVCGHFRYSEPVPISIDTVVDYLYERGPLTDEAVSQLKRQGLPDDAIEKERNNRLSPATMRRHLAAIRYVHWLAGHPDPTDNPDVKGLVKQLFNVHRRRPTKRGGQAPALPLVALQAATARGLDNDDRIDARDRAFLLIGFFGAFRQSELAGLKFEQITEAPEGGLAVRMGETKNYKGAFEDVYKYLPFRAGCPLCPVSALREWQSILGESQGHVFRGRRSRHDQRFMDRALSDNSCNAILRRRLELAGEPEPGRFSCHSLRAGFITAGAEMGTENALLMSQSHHKDERSLGQYVRLADISSKDVAGRMIDHFLGTRQGALEHAPSYPKLPDGSSSS